MLLSLFKKLLFLPIFLGLLTSWNAKAGFISYPIKTWATQVGTLAGGIFDDPRCHKAILQAYQENSRLVESPFNFARNATFFEIHLQLYYSLLDALDDVRENNGEFSLPAPCLQLMNSLLKASPLPRIDDTEKTLIIRSLERRNQGRFLLPLQSFYLEELKRALTSNFNPSLPGSPFQRLSLDDFFESEYIWDSYLQTSEMITGPELQLINIHSKAKEALDRVDGISASYYSDDALISQINAGPESELRIEVGAFDTPLVQRNGAYYVDLVGRNVDHTLRIARGLGVEEPTGCIADLTRYPIVADSNSARTLVSRNFPWPVESVRQKTPDILKEFQRVLKPGGTIYILWSRFTSLGQSRNEAILEAHKRFSLHLKVAKQLKLKRELITSDTWMGIALHSK